MLEKATIDLIKKSIKDINKEKDLNIRLQMMIDIKDRIRNEINELLDDLFAEIEIKPKKFQLNENYTDD